MIEEKDPRMFRPLKKMHLSITFSICAMAGLDPAIAQTPAGPTPGAADAADARSPHARLCHGERIARRRQRSGQR